MIVIRCPICNLDGTLETSGKQIGFSKKVIYTCPHYKSILDINLMINIKKDNLHNNNIDINDKVKIYGLKMTGNGKTWMDLFYSTPELAEEGRKEWKTYYYNCIIEIKEITLDRKKSEFKNVG